MNRVRLLSAAFMVPAIICFALPAAGGTEDEFLLPRRDYNWSFPADHANHPGYQLEWWYYTGHLLPDGADAGDTEAWYHVQLTFFRNALPGKDSGELYFAHLALSGKDRPFVFDEKIARGTLGEAGAENEACHVWIDNWSVMVLADRHLLQAFSSEIGGFRLLADPGGREPVLQGENGYSKKGPGENEASQYYSLPGMETKGYLLLPGENERRTIPVHGTLWMDHEFGNQRLGEGLVGWDWFALDTGGGNHLVLYLVRNRDGEPIAESAGTWIPAEGQPESLGLEEFSVESTGRWTSPESGITYPSGWRIRVPGKDLSLVLEPFRKGQELRTERSTRVTYWEGAVIVREEDGDDWTWGFVELVGYSTEGEAGDGRHTRSQ